MTFIFGDFFSKWRVAKLSKQKTFVIDIKYRNRFILPVMKILYDNGVIKSFHYQPGKTLLTVYFKHYDEDIKSFNITVISTPGHRVYWSLAKLSRQYNRNTFNGFYILSTKYGLKTSTECLFKCYVGGEVLLKVEI